MLSRMCVARSSATVTQVLKSPVPQKLVPKNYVITIRNYAREPRARMASRTQPTLWERLMAPAGPNAFGIGKGALAGASAVGLGALCYYGSGVKPGTLQEAQSIRQPHKTDMDIASVINLLSADSTENRHRDIVTSNNIVDLSENSLITLDPVETQQSVSFTLWPQYVKDRIKATYGYIAGSLIITAGSAVTVFRTPALLNLVARNGWMSIIMTMGLMIGSGMVVRGMEYRPGFGPKQLAWIVHTGIMGAVIAPICFLGGPVLMRAAWYTAGVVGGLSTLAVCAPSGEFLNMRAPLAMGLGAVFAASLAGMFLPPTSALGAGLYSLSLYGGLIVFSGFLLYDTQAIIKRAEMHPMLGFQPYDPINSAVSVYLDVLNIFMRIAMILAGGGGNRKK